MKSIIILFAAFVLSSFSSNEQKEYKVILTQIQVKEVQDKIAAIHDYMGKSNLPHQEVLQIQKALMECYQTLGSGKIDSLRK